VKQGLDFGLFLFDRFLSGRFLVTLETFFESTDPSAHLAGDLADTADAKQDDDDYEDDD
jgi:hypothetical protein